jgi:hypothetical protein
MSGCRTRCSASRSGRSSRRAKGPATLRVRRELDDGHLCGGLARHTRKLAYFRRAVLAGTRLASATIGTIRLHLLKVAERVVRSVRRLWFHLASSWPGQPLFNGVSSRPGTRARIAKAHAPESSAVLRRRPEVSSLGRMADRSPTSDVPHQGLTTSPQPFSIASESSQRAMAL